MSPFFHDPEESILQDESATEFNVGADDFAALEIRASDNFYFFFDPVNDRLIKNFLLEERPNVDTLCGVILVKKGERLSPRLSFWKKDKTKGASLNRTPRQATPGSRASIVKSRVDVGDCYENFWKLIGFLRSHPSLDVPDEVLPADSHSGLDLTEVFAGHDKNAILSAVKTYLEGQVTEEDVQMLLDRRSSVDHFYRLLTDSEFFAAEKVRLHTGGEGVWQTFFEENTWIFGYGLTLVACVKYRDEKLEQITTGSNVFSGGGKRSDALMRTKGFIQTLLFAEIKKHDTRLLMTQPYRKPDVYQVSNELSGAVSQVQKTSYKAVTSLGALYRSYAPEGEYQFEISTIRPRQVVVIGNLSELADGTAVNIEKMTSFELYRRDQHDVEILTFDELYERARFIVERQEAGGRAVT